MYEVINTDYSGIVLELLLVVLQGSISYNAVKCVTTSLPMMVRRAIWQTYGVP